MKRVVFLCVENSCRSQIAEAFARRIAGPGVDVYSAGSQPSGHVHASAISLMRELGIELSDQRSKGLNDLPQVEFDIAVTMGCGDACPNLRARTREDWNIRDPKGLPLDE